MIPGVGCLTRSDLLIYLPLHFNSLKCRSPYLSGNVSPDCLGNSPLPAYNESGQGLEQLNKRDNQSLIQTAMQNIQAVPSENVLSGILDFKSHLINLEEEFGEETQSQIHVNRPGDNRTRKLRVGTTNAKRTDQLPHLEK